MDTERSTFIRKIAADNVAGDQDLLGKLANTMNFMTVDDLLAAVGYNVRGDTQGLGLVIRLILGALGAITVMAFWLARHHARGERIRVKV